MKKFSYFLEAPLDEYFEENYPLLLDELCGCQKTIFETDCCDEYSKNPRLFIFKNNIPYESIDSLTEGKKLHSIQKLNDTSLRIVELIEYGGQGRRISL